MWLIATLTLVAALARRDAIVGDAIDGLVPTDHRPTIDSTWVVLEIGERERDEGGEIIEIGEVAEGDAASEGPAARERLEAAAAAIHAALPGAWTPIAPPAQEAAAWLESHVLYLVPPTRHRELAARVTPAAIDGAIAGIRARLSSPLFAATGEEPRRDPLGLRALLGDAALGLTAAPGRAEATAAGDLIAADGRALLLELRGEGPASATVERARAAIDDRAIRMKAAGEPLRRERSAEAVTRGLPRAPVSAAALALLVLALGLRAAAPVLMIVAATASGLATLAALGGPIDLLTLPLLVALVGVAGEGLVQRQTIAASGWAAPAITALALFPLLLAPYPLWQRWALAWALAALALFVALRLIGAALPGRLLAGRGLALHLRPWPPLAIVLSAGFLGAGAFAAESLEIRGPAAIELGDRDLEETRAAVRRDFFDPARIVSVSSRGDDLEDALGASIADAAAIVEGLGGELRHLDAPGALVIDAAAIDARREALEALEIPARMIDLEAAIKGAGLRVSAFAEVLKGAADLDSTPSATAALGGPLRGWIASHALIDDDGGDGVVLRSRAFIDGELDGDALPRGDGGRTQLRGPAVADDRDVQRLRGRLGLYAAAGLWIGALILWLATRDLALALAAAITAVASECGVLLLLLALDLPLGAPLLPALLLVGASGMIAGGRACRAIDRGAPLLAGAMLLSSLAQVAAGIALIATREPLWQAFGSALAGGAALAPGLGIFAAPGLYALLRRLTRERRG
ncbi:MAG: hypothetical protein H6711_01575 [Myxococcales bacterium]|nr:hypothetical protein [Myxococcales bacterium]